MDKYAVCNTCKRKRNINIAPECPICIDFAPRRVAEKKKEPVCHHKDSFVTDSRNTADGVRRRRMCKLCSFRWTTIEVELAHPVILKKREQREKDRLRADLLIKFNETSVLLEKMIG